jgi:transcriptional regulator with XRE-family HTH domain
LRASREALAAEVLPAVRARLFGPDGTQVRDGTLFGMSGVHRNELGQFLRARREQVRPESAGLSGAGRRRVAGLRRDELARLSDISTEYYVRLEQGRDQNPSSQVLEALARALGLDDQATAHLYRLSRPLPGASHTCDRSASPAVQQLIASWPTTPALVVDRLTTVLAANALGRLLSEAHRPGTNLLRTLFLDPAAKAFYLDWDAETEALVAGMRSAPVVVGDDPLLADLTEELSAHSERFRALWDRHDIRARASGVSALYHPRVGRLELRYERLGVLSAAGPCPNCAVQHVIAFQAEQGSVSAHRLASLMDAEASADTYGLLSDQLEHGVVVRRGRGDVLDRIPLLDDLAVLDAE